MSMWWRCYRFRGLQGDSQEGHGAVKKINLSSGFKVGLIITRGLFLKEGIENLSMGENEFLCVVT